ncbi:hypothetical protein BHE74_00040795 [Ensete ventricosum]|uniref:Uncharacterized protein n=1 Tax=Ensete ventricosum TaxID=4639 RepID=A0A426Z056_ENSVE|nr:hypothetical protein B296_00039416 [Ensete ventricosum]RWW52765.1 hypothetical protein BHE74_00040795 [Ensete ventricosum]
MLKLLLPNKELEQTLRTSRHGTHSTQAPRPRGFLCEKRPENTTFPRKDSQNQEAGGSKDRGVSAATRNRANKKGEKNATYRNRKRQTGRGIYRTGKRSKWLHSPSSKDGDCASGRPASLRRRRTSLYTPILWRCCCRLWVWDESAAARLPQLSVASSIAIQESKPRKKPKALEKERSNLGLLNVTPVRAKHPLLRRRMDRGRDRP